MQILLIGGTGIISSAVTELLLAQGHTVFLLNRGQRKNEFSGRTRDITVDKNDRAALKSAIDKLDAPKTASGLQFDAVANFIAYNARDVELDVEMFSGRTSQYLVISSASAYQKPPNHYRVTESTPLCNPFWEYSRNKIALEEAAIRAYRETAFPVTIVRPSYTYSKFFVPGLLGLNFRHFERIRQGKPLVVHGDGQSLWQMTFNEDFARGFVGLIGNPRALGESCHITSDEVLTWDQIFKTMGRAVGVEPKLVHVPVEFIRRVEPSVYDGLKGDKMYSLVLDNTKIKSVVTAYEAKVSFYEGMCRCLAYAAEHPEVLAAGAEAEAKADKIASAWESAMRSIG
jgi:nucleoside-diphosphate-sugar epimerase